MFNNRVISISSIYLEKKNIIPDFFSRFSRRF